MMNNFPVWLNLYSILESSIPELDFNSSLVSFHLLFMGISEPWIGHLKM